MKPIITFAFLSLALLSVSFASADTFGSIDIDFVTIGDPGNDADTNPSGNPLQAGKVDYSYRISTYEISEGMIDAAGLGITHNSRGADKPATSISWYEAATFVNWLNTESGSTAAYKFDVGGNFQLWSPGDAGYNASNLYRNSEARYFLPSADEWYKAAYYNADTASYGNYPTANGLVPAAVSSGTTANTAVFGQPLLNGPADITQAGGLSSYGTVGQGGNVFEWEETSSDLLNGSSSSSRGFRGGNWFNSSNILSSSIRASFNPSIEDNKVGFRVASVPEPSTALLGVLTTVGLLLRRRRSS